MMHCRKKLLAGEEQGYFNEKRRVNVRATNFLFTPDVVAGL